MAISQSPCSPNADGRALVRATHPAWSSSISEQRTHPTMCALASWILSCIRMNFDLTAAPAAPRHLSGRGACSHPLPRAPGARLRRPQTGSADRRPRPWHARCQSQRRPFTGDYAGVLLYETLHRFG